MLEARSVALVGASPRPGTLGQRMVAEVARSPSAPRMYLVNPRYTEITGMPCHPSLADLPELADTLELFAAGRSPGRARCQPAHLRSGRAVAVDALAVPAARSG